MLYTGSQYEMLFLFLALTLIRYFYVGERYLFFDHIIHFCWMQLMRVWYIKIKVKISISWLLFITVLSHLIWIQVFKSIWIQMFKSKTNIKFKIRENALKVPKSAKRKMRSILQPHRISISKPYHMVNRWPLRRFHHLHVLVKVFMLDILRVKFFKKRSRVWILILVLIAYKRWYLL